MKVVGTEMSLIEVGFAAAVKESAIAGFGFETEVAGKRHGIVEIKKIAALVVVAIAGVVVVIVEDDYVGSGIAVDLGFADPDLVVTGQGIVDLAKMTKGVIAASAGLAAGWKKTVAFGCGAAAGIAEAMIGQMMVGEGVAAGGIASVTVGQLAAVEKEVVAEPAAAAKPR